MTKPLKITLLALGLFLGYTNSIYSQNTPCNAINLTILPPPGFQTFQTNGLTNSGIPQPLCGGNISNDIWFEVTSTGTGYLNIITQANTLTDMAMAVYTGTCNNLVEIACSIDDNCGNSIMPIIHLNEVPPGTTYFIRIWNELGGNGSFDIQVLDAIPQAPLLNLVTVGSAVISSSNCVQLTSEQTFLQGCAWNPVLVDFSQPIENTFLVNLGNIDAQGADGICLIYQNNPNGLATCGVTGGGIAAAGITNSFIVEFDTYDNGGGVNDIGPDHIAISINGDLDNPINGPVSLGNIEDGNDHLVRFTWDPATNIYEIYFDGILMISGNYDIINNCFGGSNMVYCGFTASTGGGVNNQQVCFEPPVTYPSGIESYAVAETCETDPYFVGGGYQNTSGVYQDVYPTTDGCDSIITTALTVYPITYSFFKDTICEGECLIFSGETFCTSGPHQIVRQSQFFCDSIITLEIEILYPIIDILPTGVISCGSPDVLLDASFSDNYPGFIFQWTGPGDGCITGDDQALITTAICGGTYRFDIFQPLGDQFCSNYQEFDVLIDTIPPTIIIQNADELSCATNCITLDANMSSTGNIFNYEWAGPNGFTATDLNPMVCNPGQYYLKIHNTFTGCTNIDSIYVPIDSQSPVADAGGDQILDCNQENISLNAGNSSLGNNFEAHWEDTDGNELGTTSILNVVEAGAYSFVVTSLSNGCIERDTAIVSTNIIPPNAVAVADGILDCSEQPVVLDGSTSSSSEMYAFLWQNNLGQNIGTDTTLLVQNIGIYHLITSNLTNGCSDTTFVSVLGNITPPNANAGADQSIDCINLEATLNGNNSTGQGLLLFQWADNLGNPLDNTPEFSTNTPGDYTLTITDQSNNCLDTAYVSIINNQNNPTADAGLDFSLNCNNPDTQMGGNNTSIGSDFIYNWANINNQNIGTAPNQTISEAGEYTLMVSDTTNGCIHTDEVTITADFILPFVDAGPDQIINCQENSAPIDGSNSSDGNNFSYLWTYENGTVIGSDPVNLVSQAGEYYLNITNNENGCFASDTILLTLDANFPVALIEDTAPIDCNQTMRVLDGSQSTNTPSITYEWQNQSSSTIGSANQIDISNPGQYSLIVTNTENACKDTSIIIVEDNRIYPLADAGLDFLLNCYTPEVQIGGETTSTGSNYQYSWINEDSQSLDTNPTILITSAGTFTIMVSDTSNGCITIDQVIISENFLPPTADAGLDQIINCQNTSTTLNAENSSVGNNYSYHWTAENGTIIDTSIMVTISEDGNYQFSVLNTINGCTADDTVLITEDKVMPTALIEDITALSCDTTNLVLDGSNSSDHATITYQWTDEDLNELGQSNQLNINTPGNYTLEVLDTNNGCKITTNIQVEIDTIPPAFSLLEEALINCFEPIATLGDATLIDSISWQFDWTNESGLNIGQDPILNINAIGNYQLLISDQNNGCSSSAIIVVTDDFIQPIADAGTDDILDCYQPEITIGGNNTSQGSNISYQWYSQWGEVINTTSNYTTISEGHYIFIVTDETNGCRDTSYVQLDLDQTPPITTAIVNDILTCSQTSLPLIANGSDFGPNFDINWSTLSGGIIQEETDPLTPTVQDPGVYQLMILNQENGCTDSVQVTVNQNIIDPIAHAGDNFELDCLSPTASLDGSASFPQNNLSFDWSTVNGSLEGNTNIATPIISGPGIYLLQVTDLNNGCTDDTAVEIVSNFITNFELSLNQPKCFGDLGNIQIGNIIGGRPPFLYSIDNGDSFQQQAIFAQLEPGNYPVVIQDINGCEREDAASITPPVEIIINLQPQVTIKLGQSYQLKAETNLGIEEIGHLIWTPAETLSCDTCLITLAQPLQTTDYHILISDTNGCYNSALTTIFVDRRINIFVPNAFSPNADGQNDDLIIFSDLHDNLTIKSFQVYSRWGELMFESYNFSPNDPDHGWDGYHRGKVMNPAVFIWYTEVALPDGSIELFKGEVVLVK